MIDVLNEKQIADLRNMVKESVDSLMRQDAEKTLRSEIAARAKEELEFSRKQFNQLVKVVYKQNLEELETELTALTDIVEIIGAQ